MSRSAMEKRVSTLEEEMKEMARQVTLLAISVRELKDEMKEFKDEMRVWKEESEQRRKSFEKGMEEFKQEMKEFKDEMRTWKEESEQRRKSFEKGMEEFKQEMKEFKDEMRVWKEESEQRRKSFEKGMEEFKQEMKEFKDEMRKFKDEMNKKWGWVINKLGTMVEDLIYPSIDEVIEKYFSCKPDRKMIRVEFNCVEIDVLAICQGKAFIVEAKSRPDNRIYIDEFKEKLGRVKDCIKWLREYEVYGIYSGWNMKEETVRYLTENGIYAMVVKGDILTIVNSHINPSVW